MSNFKVDATGVLNFPKSYEKMLRESGDEDYIKLADMNGKRVEMYIPLQPAVSKSMINVGIREPIPMTLSYSQFKDVQYE